MKNAKGSFLMLVIALVIIGIGYVVINAGTSAIDGTTPSNNLACNTINTAYSVYPPIIMHCIWNCSVLLQIYLAQ